MFKKIFNKKDNKGYVSIEVIIIAAIILSLFAFLFLRWSKTADDLSTSTIVGMEERVNNMKDPKTGESFIDMENDPNTLLGKMKPQTKSFTFEGSSSQEQTITFKINNLKQVMNISASNGGTVEILSTNGNEITVKVTGGEPVERIVIAGEYLPYDEKVITGYDTENYDDGVYKGTLKQYLHSGEESKVTTVTEKKTYTSLNAIPSTNTYNVAGYKGTLSKDGEAEKVLVSGTASMTKEVSKTVTQTTNNFENTLSYNENGYSGTLTKSGNVVSTLISGVAGDSKYVSGQTSANYNVDGYVGTLTKNVARGGESQSKTVTTTGETVTSSAESYTFPSTKAYIESVVVNGVTTNYTGTLTLTSNNKTTISSKVVRGSAADSKTVTQSTICTEFDNGEYSNSCFNVVLNYTEAVNDNGVNTHYTGTYQYTSYEVTDVGYSSSKDSHYVRYIQYYTATVTKPDTRVYENVYSYAPTYSGTVSTPDTRVYDYAGTVTKPDTRVYSYEQTYKGNVATLDTRVYNYIQSYTGEVKTPDTRVYKYQGVVSRPESDTRKYENLYQYDLKVKYTLN